MAGFDETSLRAGIDRILNRRPTVGLAVGVVRDGSLELFEGHGWADIESRTPVTEGTGFRIASITKTFTAVAVMQLWEQGLIDLDAPANDYLRAYRLVPARASFGPATVRHLLTHTAGIREVLHPWGLLRMRDFGETVRAGRPVPSLAEYYGGALHVDAEPGTRFTYSNHGFATLGQIISDVTGVPLDVYYREQIFEPLGMPDTELGVGERIRSRMATGYKVGPGGAKRIGDYTLITAGAGGICSTPRDMAQYLSALLGGGANQHGFVLKPSTLATMFEPHCQADPRLPGLGLAFFRDEMGGHLTVAHDGILPGFDSPIVVVPDAGIALMAFATGAPRGLHWLAAETDRLTRGLLGVAEPVVRTDIALRPELWHELVGWYRFSQRFTDPAAFLIGAGAEVFVRRGRLMMRFLGAVPSAMELHPDDANDPDAFRFELPWFGDGTSTSRVVFTRKPGVGVAALGFEFAPLSMPKQPAATNPRLWATGAVAAGALGAAAGLWRRHRARKEV